MTSLWPYRSSEVKGQGAKWKLRYDFLSKVNSNCMPIWYRFQDIGSFNNLLIKLIKLITMVWSGPNSIGFGGWAKPGSITKVKISAFILHHSEETDRWKDYIVTLTFQGHPRSKVMVPNERLYACSYLWIIVTICLTGTVSKILALLYKENS